MPLAINFKSLWKILFNKFYRQIQSVDCDLEEIEIEDKRQEFWFIS